MEKTQEEALKRALVLLKAAGVEYAIRTNDGEVHGTLMIMEAIPEKRRTRRPSNVPKEVRMAQREILKQMQPGDCKRFAIGEYPRETIRGAITGACNQMWGKSAHISTIHKDTNEVEILRLE